MKSIVFNPEWTVPDTIIREDLGPSLRQGGFVRPRHVGVERAWAQGQYQGRPIDPDTVDWGRANVFQYTFTQAPGPANVLGKLKFNFPTARDLHARYGAAGVLR